MSTLLDAFAMVLVHQQYNRETAGLYEQFAEHREMLTTILLAVADRFPKPRRLAILGAGNCNDVDLERLASSYARVDLIDIDGEALDRAKPKFESAKIDVGIHVIDLHPAALIDERRTAPAITVPNELSAEFDVVLSACMLSQVIHEICIAGNANDVDIEKAVLGVRSCHTSTILELLKDDGAGLLGVDFVSSETLPGLNDKGEIISACAKAIRTQNFFTGCNPLAIHQELLAKNSELYCVTLSKPWRWRIGGKTHAVAMHGFRKSKPAG